jgi:recombination associated protein RdgC
VRDALGSFPARPLASEASLSLLMSEWLISGNLPGGFELGDECELKDPSDQASVVRCRHHDLGADEIREHARCGKQVTQLGLVFDGRIGCVLDAKLKLRKLNFLDIVADKLDAQDGADPDQILDAEFALMSLELRRLFARLDEILRFVD